MNKQLTNDDNEHTDAEIIHIQEASQLIKLPSGSRWRFGLRKCQNESATNVPKVIISPFGSAYF